MMIVVHTEHSDLDVQKVEMLQRAWEIIANAGGWRATGDEPEEWMKAASRWRDEYFDFLYDWLLDFRS